MLSVTQVIDGRYTIKRRLGIGGMAEVYLAIDESLGREVALKVLNPALAADPAFVERFKREARAVAALNHPNIVAIYNWGEYDGMYYIVMEYVPGENLKEQLRQVRALPEEDALAIAVLVANALEAAHVRGIVHRDVKPHNILLAPDGRVKVTDFGIAWAAGASQLTATNAVLGTAHYLSPEQVTHHAIDGRTDVYGLGVVLFEMLTGMTPFTGDTLVAVAMKQATETAPSIRTLRPDLSLRTDAIVRTALAKDPGARFPTAAAMRDALQAARDALLRPLSTQTVLAASSPPLAAMPPGNPVLPMTSDTDAAAAMTRLVQMRNAPPPFLPSARRANNDRILPLVAVIALLTLFVVGILAGGRLFGRSTGITTAIPAGATQIAGGLLPLPSPTTPATTTTAATATVTRTASTPVPASIAPTASSLITPTVIAVATPVSPLPVGVPTVPLPTMALPVPTATIALVLVLPTSVPPTAVSPTAVPPPPPMPTATATLPTATVVPPTAVPAPPMVIDPPQAAVDNSTPIGAVRGFYQLVSAHQFDAAASLWSARQQAQYPPASNIAGRFANTLEVSVDMARIANQNANTATVVLTITEVKQGQAPQRYNGTWQLVHGPSGWLLDQPNLQPG